MNVNLSSGYAISSPGFGTSARRDARGEIYASVKEALKNGYRHVDTSEIYRNEHEIGEAIYDAISDGTIKREEVFLCTKMGPYNMLPELVRDACQSSLEKLRTTYIDLYLLHFPIAKTAEFYEDGPANPYEKARNYLSRDVNFLDIYKEMERLVDDGLVRSLGICNVNLEQLKRLYEKSRIKPSVLQIECNLRMFEDELIEFCHTNGIVVTGFAPLGSPGFNHFYCENFPPLLEDTIVMKLAAKYNREPAQICLRYLTQRGVIPICKSFNPQRIRSNIQLFDFSLEDCDLHELRTLNKRMRQFTFLYPPPHPNNLLKHKEFPWPELADLVRGNK